MENLIVKASRKVNLYFLLTIGLGVGLIAVGYALNKCCVLNIPAKAALILSTLSMLYLVSSIPSALWFCNKKTAQLGGVDDIETRYAEYIKWVRIRVIAVGSNLWINIVLYYLMHTLSFSYAAGIGAIALLFCKPNKVTIEKELNITTEIK